jgi:hypothetical protein
MKERMNMHACNCRCASMYASVQGCPSDGAGESRRANADTGIGATPTSRVRYANQAGEEKDGQRKKGMISS